LAKRIEVVGREEVGVFQRDFLPRLEASKRDFEPARQVRAEIDEPRFLSEQFNVGGLVPALNAVRLNG